MAIAEVYVIGAVAVAAVSGNMPWEYIIALALGGGVGCMASMWAHTKVFKNGEELEDGIH